MEYYFILIVAFAGVTNAYINMAIYRQQILDLHNNVRRMEPSANMQKMRWNTQLENEAAMWASNCMFDHQQRGRGENLAMHTAPWDYARLINTGITMWSDEKRQYTYGSSGFSQATGHYTQMVWADTTDVGCGMTRCPSLSMGGGSPMQNAWFLVCFYSPAGNVIGQLPYVSGPQCSQCGRGQYCDRGLCSSTPGTTPPKGGMGGGGGSPSRHTGGGKQTGGGRQPGGQMPGSGSPFGQQNPGNNPGGQPMGGGGAPFGQQNPGNNPGGQPMGGGGAPGGQLPSGNMGGSPSLAGNNLGTIGGGPGMPSISFQNGFPMINIGNPPAGGGPGSKAPTKPGTNAQPSKPNPSMKNGLISSTPGGSISIWGFQKSQSTQGGNNCKDQSWCRMWGELCADPKYSRKFARECPVTCGKCGAGSGGPSGGAGSTGGPACVDAIEGCVFWKQIGMCNVPFYQTYITETCARTCRLC